MRERAFLATKVWTAGRDAGVDQMEDSLRKLRTLRVELMQVHNLVDWQVHLRTLRRWRDEGRIRYIEVTHYTASALPELSRIVESEKLDFVQFALSLDEPWAAGDFLKKCADRGVAFIANRPLGGGGALSRVRGRKLPPWAEEQGIASWAQFLLKWVLAHPEVTCAIPGTGKPAHMRDNLAAAMGVIPDPALREKMSAFWNTV